MKKFTFNLAALQTVRGWHEQKARQELAATTGRVAQLEQALADLGSEREQAFASWNLAPNHRFAPRDRLNVDSHVAQVEARAAKMRSELAAAQAARAAAVAQLVRASRDLKVVENLRDQRFQEYSAELLRHEAAEIEDVFNARRSARSPS